MNMSVCVSAYFQPASMYPVFNPRMTAGPGPWRYAIALFMDQLQIAVNRNPVLTRCEMNVSIVSTLPSDKQIAAWNFFKNGSVSVIGTTVGLPMTMKISKTQGPPSCMTNTDTVVLFKRGTFNALMAAASFNPVDFWDFWGGCDVTFMWFADDKGTGLWGEQTPEPTYPMVRSPDGTLLFDPQTMRFSVVIGGAEFAIDNALLRLMGFRPNQAVVGRLGITTPADFTLIRELWRPEVFVVYGGAKFWIPDTKTLADLGFSGSQVHIVPPGGTNQLTAMPFDGTLIKESSDPRVFLVNNQMLSWVSSEARMGELCLPWRHIRTVPDGALKTLPQGPDL
jgi:hypothetical protein